MANIIHALTKLVHKIQANLEAVRLRRERALKELHLAKLKREDEKLHQHLSEVDSALGEIVSPLPTEEEIDKAGKEAIAISLRLDAFWKKEYKDAEKHWRKLKNARYAHERFSHNRAHLMERVSRNEGLQKHLEAELAQAA